jgi:hypothetical protein
MLKKTCFRISLGPTITGLVFLSTVHARADQPMTHDGLQLRGAIGPGFLSDSESDDQGNSSTVSGLAGSLEVYVGGTPLPGFTVGGFFSGATVPSPSVSAGGQSVTVNGASITLGQIGPYVDWYPTPTGGFHVLGGAGLAFLSLNNGETAPDGSSSSTNSGAGFGLDAGVGYDWWITDKWSIGALARFTYARTSLSQSSTDSMGNAITINTTDSMIVPAVLFSANWQ